MHIESNYLILHLQFESINFIFHLQFKSKFNHFKIKKMPTIHAAAALRFIDGGADVVATARSRHEQTPEDAALKVIQVLKREEKRTTSRW